MNTNMIPIQHLQGHLDGDWKLKDGHKWNKQQHVNMMSPLDVFDPYDQLDQSQSHSHLHWLTRPESMRQRDQQPEVPRRYQIKVDCRGFEPNSLKTKVEGSTQGGIRLVVSGLEELGKRGTDSFTLHEIKRSFKLPSTVDTKKMVSYMTKKGVLVIEFPVKQTTKVPHHDTMQTNMKEMLLKLEIPQGIDKNKIHLVIMGQDLILKCEDVTVTSDSAASIHLYERIRLPENTDLASLKCVKQLDHLLVSVALLSHHVSRGMHVSPLQKEIPIVERSDRSSLGLDGAMGGMSLDGIEIESIPEETKTQPMSNKNKKKSKNVSSNIGF